MNKKLLLTCLITGALALGNHLRAQTATTTEPFVLISATDPTALEGTSSGAFTLTRNGNTNADLTVYVDILGTASNGVDYAQISAAITIPAGYLAVDIAVQPIIDTVNRGNKTVILAIQTNADYQLGGDHRAVVTIIDDVFNTPAPTVTITDPTNGSAFANPADITLTADASDPGANIESVSFYANDDFLGRATNTPYSLVWTNARAGRYTLFARVIDNLNQSALSPLVQITVTDVLPVVTITTPTNGANFAAHQDIPVAADVADADATATITTVDFYDNGRFLAAATNAPYQIVWSNAPAGLYTLQAAATDNAGQRGYSKGVVINISRPPH
jgi:hypothetical protein